MDNRSWRCSQGSWARGSMLTEKKNDRRSVRRRIFIVLRWLLRKRLRENRGVRCLGARGVFDLTQECGEARAEVGTELLRSAGPASNGDDSPVATAPGSDIYTPTGCAAFSGA